MKPIWHPYLPSKLDLSGELLCQAGILRHMKRKGKKNIRQNYEMYKNKNTVGSTQANVVGVGGMGE